MPSKSNGYVRVAYEKGYRVTDDGRTFSHKGKLLKHGNIKYPNFSVVVDGVRQTVKAHRLAAYCFYGEDAFKEGIQVRHLNADTRDYSRQNIAIGTAQENEADKTEEARKRTNDARLLHFKGRKSYTRKLTDDDAAEVWRMLDAGVIQKHIAEKFNVTIAVISLIKTGVTYRETYAERFAR